MILDRTIPPTVYDIGDISLPQIDSSEINGINVHAFLDPGSQTFKIELLTKGSQLHGDTAALPQLALRMLNEGTEEKTSGQLAEAIDSLGSFIEISPGFDYSSITIYGLSKYFQENLRLLSEIIYQPKFSPESLETLKIKEADKLKLNLEKGSYISSINLRKSLFGNEHPYGKHLISSQLQSVTIEDILNFHNSYSKDFAVYISGDLPSDYRMIISDHFEGTVSNTQQNLFLNPVEHSKDIFHQDSKFIQSSIKVGKRLFTRTHADYFSFIVTNELFGGFFGSRLMKNIREDKGFTYGIHSSLYALLHDGYFLISTDVKGDNQQETIDEILKEIATLQTKPVSLEELDVVKNYMIGVFTNSFSSPFANIDKFKTLNSQGISLELYSSYISKVREITPKMVMNCAIKYLDPKSLTTSIAGS